MTSHCGNPYPHTLSASGKIGPVTICTDECKCVETGMFALTDFNTIEFDGQWIMCAGAKVEGKN